MQTIAEYWGLWDMIIGKEIWKKEPKIEDYQEKMREAQKRETQKVFWTKYWEERYESDKCKSF
jgi:hypothetical protein